MTAKAKIAYASLSVLASLAVAAGALPATLAANSTKTSAIAETASASYDLAGTSKIKITEDGVYRITGSSAEGSITVAKDVAATIILDNATLSSSTTAPIVCKSGSNVTIEVSGTSTLTNREDIANEASDGFEGAAIKAKSGASLTITGDGTLNVNGTTKNGIKGASDASITIKSGTLNITAANDVVNSGGSVTVTGGTLTIDAADDGLHADGIVTIGTEGSETGPVINIVNSYEGIEGAQVILNSGTGYVRSSDDGINAADDENGTVGIIVNGGDWYVNADGDGLDAGGGSNRGNGSIFLNGGTVTVYGAADNGNGALDSESGIVYNGGTLIAVGMSGMAEVPSGTKVLVFGGSGIQGGMVGGMPGGQPGQGARNGQWDFGGPQMGGMNGQQGGSISISEGSTIVIKDSEGNVVYEATGVKDANSVIFASGGLTEGGTYTLYVDGQAAASAVAGSGAQGGVVGRQGPQFSQNQQDDRQGLQSGQDQQNGQQGPRFGQDRQNSFGGPRMGGMDDGFGGPQAGDAPDMEGRFGGPRMGGMQNGPMSGMEQGDMDGRFRLMR